MRRTSLGLILSAAVHVAGVIVVAGVWPSARRVAAAELRGGPRSPAPLAADAAPALETVAADEILQLAIVELPPDLEAVVAATPPPLPEPTRPPAHPPRGAGASSASIVATTSALGSNAVVEPPPAAPEPPAPRSALSMRNPLPTRLVMPDLRKIAEAGPAVAAAPRARLGAEAEANRDGTFSVERAGFTAQINRDGTVALSDKPNFNVNLALPSPKALGQGLADWAKNPYAQTRDREREAEQGRVPSGAVDDEEEQRKRPKTIPLVSGSFDVTDWLMRLSGRDPYFAAKLSMLNRTREARAEMATAYRSEMLSKVVKMVREQAAAVWGDGTQPAVARRRALFELWDDCAEKGDAELVTAGKRARVALYGYMRAHARQGTADGYSAEELAELNRARRSRQRFAPYPEEAVDDTAEAAEPEAEAPAD